MGPGQSDASPSNRRLTVPEAAERLGITEAAVRGRVKRGTLRSVRERGTVYVLLIGGESASNRDESSGEPADQSELVEELRDRVRYLEEANRENRRIIAGLVQRIPELEAPSEPRDAPETGAEPQMGTEVPTPPREPEAGVQEHSPMGERPTEETVRRSWWRRIFGG